MHFLTTKPKCAPCQSAGTRPVNQQRNFLIATYKPIYLLPARWIDHPNEQPISGNDNPDYIAPPSTDLNNVETKFQISFKTKLIHGIFWGQGDLWARTPDRALASIQQRFVAAVSRNQLPTRAHA
jgi:hypothetical protein